VQLCIAGKNIKSDPSATEIYRMIIQLHLLALDIDTPHLTSQQTEATTSADQNPRNNGRTAASPVIVRGDPAGPIVDLGAHQVPRRAALVVREAVAADVRPLEFGPRRAVGVVDVPRDSAVMSLLEGGGPGGLGK